MFIVAAEDHLEAASRTEEEDKEVVVMVPLKAQEHATIFEILGVSSSTAVSVNKKKDHGTHIESKPSGKSVVPTASVSLAALCRHNVNG